MIAVHIFKPSSPSLTGAIYTGGRAIAVTHSVWFSETDVASVYDSPAVHGLRHEPETESIVRSRPILLVIRPSSRRVMGIRSREARVSGRLVARIITDKMSVS